MRKRQEFTTPSKGNKLTQLADTFQKVEIANLEREVSRLGRKYARLAKKMAMYGVLDAIARKADVFAQNRLKDRHRLRAVDTLDKILLKKEMLKAALETNQTALQRMLDDTDNLATIAFFKQDLALYNAEGGLLPLIALKSELTQIEREIEQVEKKYNNLLHERGGIRPEKHFYDNPAGYWIASILLYSAEVSVNNTAMVEIGEISNGMAFLMAIAISGLMSIASLRAGTLLQSGKFIQGALWTLTGLALAFGVMTLRLDKSIVLTLAVFVFYGFSMLLSYSKAADSALFHSEKVLKKLERRRAVIQTKIGIQEHALLLQKVEITTTYEGETGTFTMQARDFLTRQIEESLMMAKHIESINSHMKNRINNLYTEGVINYDRAYHSISRWIPWHKRATPTSYNGKQASANGKTVSNVATFLLLGVLSVFLWGCNPAVPQDVAVIIDQTANAQNTEVSKLSEYIFKKVLPESIEGEVSLTVSTIGETSKQRIHGINLEPAGSWITRLEVERQKDVKSFSVATDSLLNLVLATKDSLGYSFVHENIAALLAELKPTEKEVHRVAVVVSDMIMNTPDLSFYRNPELLDDFEDLGHRLEERAPLPEIGDLNLRIIYLPIKSTDALFSKSLKFWTWFYERHGARVTYIPGL